MRLLLLLALVGSSSLAHADGRTRKSAGVETSSEPSVPPGYDEIVERALSEFALANYAEARSALLEAHALYANARTLRALGMVEYELKNYAASVGYLEQALASRERALTSDQRREGEQLLTRANGYIGRYVIAVRPEGAALLVDGQVPGLDARGVLMLSVGAHELEVSADGHRSQRRTLQVVGGREERIDLVLMPQGQAEPAAAGQRDQAPRADTPVYKKWWLWTTLGLVVVAGAATGIILATRPPEEPKDPHGGSLKEVVHLLEWKR